jgi:hypothetical protein
VKMSLQLRLHSDEKEGKSKPWQRRGGSDDRLAEAHDAQIYTTTMHQRLDASAYSFFPKNQLR